MIDRIQWTERDREALLASIEWYRGLALEGRAFAPEDDPRELITRGPDGDYHPVFSVDEAREIDDAMSEFWEACEEVQLDPCMVALIIAEDPGATVEDVLDEAERRDAEGLQPLAQNVSI